MSTEDPEGILDSVPGRRDWDYDANVKERTKMLGEFLRTSAKHVGTQLTYTLRSAVVMGRWLARPDSTSMCHYLTPDKWAERFPWGIRWRTIDGIKRCCACNSVYPMELLRLTEGMIRWHEKGAMEEHRALIERGEVDEQSHPMPPADTNFSARVDLYRQVPQSLHICMYGAQPCFTVDLTHAQMLSTEDYASFNAWLAQHVPELTLIRNGTASLPLYKMGLDPNPRRFGGIPMFLVPEAEEDPEG